MWPEGGLVPKSGTQKLDLLLAKNGHERVDGQAILKKTAKPFGKDAVCERRGRGSHQKIVKVDKNKRKTSKNVVNHELEHGAGGPKGIQRNSKRLMMVILGMSSGNILVPFDEVKRGENVGAIHIVRECWDQVLVQQGCIVEPGRISTWAPRAIRFGTM